MDIFWKGDRIVWKNLFRNYLICLQRAYLISQVRDKEQPLTNDDIQVFLSTDQLPTKLSKEKFERICREFFGNKHVVKLIEALSGAKREMRRDEFIHYLNAVHGFAITIVSLTEKGGRSNDDELNLSKLEAILEKFTGGPVELLMKADENHVKVADHLFKLSRQIQGQRALLAIREKSSFLSEPGKRFVVIEFPQRYVEQLERLMYPSWYVACFMSEISNASMWGHYADSHKSVCLKFKTTSFRGQIGLNLNGFTGTAINKGEKPRKIRGNSFYPFKRVSYDSKYPSVDFFRTISRLPYNQMMKFWYTDENGNVSECASDVIGKEDEWRSRLWANLSKSATVKLDEWKYENEHRLLLIPTLDNQKEASDRLWKYKFSDLDGIVFGIRTPLEAKVRVLEIIERKCHEQKREDFKFYQAEYSHTSGKIEIHELSAFKFVLQ